MDRTCIDCIHNHEHCMKHPELARNHVTENYDWFQDGCDDFWPKKPTCSECRFYDPFIPDFNGICRHIGNMLVTPERTYAARMNSEDYCSEWRCRVQS